MKPFCNSRLRSERLVSKSFKAIKATPESFGFPVLLEVTFRMGLGVDLNSFRWVPYLWFIGAEQNGPVSSATDQVTAECK
jgi:hypothetical protein